MTRFPPIPGETPIDDISGLKDKSISTRPQLNIVEAANIAKPLTKYLAAKPTTRMAPFTLNWALKLHHEMFGDVWGWAGMPRKSETNIGVPAHAIEQELKKLMDDTAYWRTHDDIDVDEQAVMIHHRAVQIHPFNNGNGRWARLLSNIWLKQADAPIVTWPEQVIGDASEIRDEYLAAVRAADGGDYAPLIELHKRYSLP